MRHDNRQLLLYLGLIFLALFIIRRLPHDSYSISQYIIPSFRLKSGAILYLSSLLPVALILIGISGLLGLERFKNRNKLLLVLTLLLIIIPIMNWGIDVTRTNYHWLRKDKLNSVDIEDARLRFSGRDTTLTMHINLTLIDYGRGPNEFSIRVYLPESIRRILGIDTYDLGNQYHTVGHRVELVITEDINFEVENTTLMLQLSEAKYLYDDTIYELYNDNEEVRIINHGP